MLLAVASMPVAWLTAYVMSPYDQAWHISTSMSRVMVHGYPLLLVAAFSSVACLLSHADPEKPRRPRGELAGAELTVARD
jgi:hypothetical protein